MSENKFPVSKLGTIGAVEVQSKKGFTVRAKISNATIADNILNLELSLCTVNFKDSGWNKIEKFPSSISISLDDPYLNVQDFGNETASPMIILRNEKNVNYFLFSKKDNIVMHNEVVEKKPFSAFFIDHEKNPSQTQLLKFITENNLKAEDYHLIVVPCISFTTETKIICIYYATKPLT